ncbi:MAG: tetratricopeptide repeat protein [Candidatus Omnitrophica bacterium]|nr:tetratricopeptide repeat protein [Candidatus Omnitrophota bacterium]
MKLKIFIFTTIVFAVLSGVLIAKNNDLNRRFDNLESVFDSAGNDLRFLKEENSTLLENNTQLKNSISSYVNITNKLKNESTNFKNRVRDSESSASAKKEKLRKLEEEVKSKDFELTKAEKKYSIDVGKLTEETKGLNAQLLREKALAYYNLGLAYVRGGFYNEAIESWENALRIDSSDFDAHYNLAVIYETKKKNTNKAVFHYNKYLQLNPDEADCSEIREKLRKLR